MRALFTLGLIVQLMLVTVSASVAASTDRLDLDFTLPAPEQSGYQQYLGLEPNQSFTLDQVKADILIIEIFSMYCPICQREAPTVNTLFERIKTIKETSVRLIGIGAGNSSFETEFFRKTYGVQFPLFSDGKFMIHKKIGEKGTPFFIGINPSAAKENWVIFTHSGEIKDMDQFIQRLLKAAE